MPGSSVSGSSCRGGRCPPPHRTPPGAGRRSSRRCNRGRARAVTGREHAGRHGDRRDAHPLPVLRPAVRDEPHAPAARGRGGVRAGGLPGEPGRVVRQGPYGGAGAVGRGAADLAAGAVPDRRARTGGLGRGAGPGRGGAGVGARGARPGRRRGVRRGRADEREGVRARQVRAGGAGHLADRLQRAVLHVVGGGRRYEGVRPGPGAALPAGGHPAHGLRDPRRLQPRRDDAAGAAVLRRTAGERRHVDRGRPAPHADRRAGGPASGTPARHRSGPGAGPVAPGGGRGANGRGVHPVPDDRLGAGAGCGDGALAGVRGTDHRRDRSPTPASCAHVLRAGVRDGADGARPGAAVQGHGHRERVDQPVPGDRPSGTPAVRVRLPDRPGQRAGRPRTRPEGGPVARLPQAGRPGGAAARGRGVGCGPGCAARPRPQRVRAAGRARHGHPRTAADGVQPGRLGTPRRPRRATAALAGLPGGVRCRPLGDGGAGGRRPAGHPVGRGDRHDDQPGRQGPAAPPSRHAARRHPQRPGGPARPRRPPRHREGLPGRPRGGLRRAAPGERGWTGGLLGDHLRQAGTGERRVLAVPGESRRGRRGCGGCRDDGGAGGAGTTEDAGGARTAGTARGAGTAGGAAHPGTPASSSTGSPPRTAGLGSSPCPTGRAPRSRTPRTRCC